MSDEPLTKETISEFMHLAEAGEPRDAYIRISVERLKSLCTLALRWMEVEHAATEPLLASVEKILNDHSAWIARPSPEVSRSVAMAAAIRAMAALDERIEFAEHETAERVREETLEEAATALDGDADTWEAQARTWSMEDHDTRADYNAALLRRAAVLVRSLKKGPSDAK